MAEGSKVISVALDVGAPVEALFYAPEASTDDRAGEVIDRALDAGVRVYELGPGVMERVADTVTPQPLLAVVPFVDVGLDVLAEASLLVVCADVRDPGNAGTVLRSAEAAGADGVVCCDGSVDVYNPKTVRASAGALFHVPVVAGGDVEQVLERLGSWGMQRLAAAAHDGREYTEMDLTAAVALVLGNEAAGVPSGLGRWIDEPISIPMAGRADSLNVGMAAAVLCFEAARQRRQRRDRPPGRSHELHQPDGGARRS
ncbi:MAG TPA: RNA methyltransferase [Acidimicrobiales bacterium]